MSKSQIIACVGCGEPFRAGRSMALHLHWRPSCRPTQPIVGHDVAGLDEDHSFPPMDDSSSVSSVFDETAFHDEDIIDGAYDDPADVNDIPHHVVLDPDHDLQNVVRFPQAYTTSQKYEVQLLNIIHTIGAPNGSFQQIMEWAQSAVNNGYDFKPMPKQYERQINHLERFVGMEACRPTEVSVAMYPYLQEDDKLDVVVFDFPSMLASLFNCPILNKPENLVVNPNDRFGKYKSPDGRLGEVNSGQWYATAYETLINDPSKDFLCPIIFTMDKTVISEMGGLSVYVILFTSSIFNRAVSFCLMYVCPPPSASYLCFRHVIKQWPGALLPIFRANSTIHRNSSTNLIPTPNNFAAFSCTKLVLPVTLKRRNQEQWIMCTCNLEIRENLSTCLFLWPLLLAIIKGATISAVGLPRMVYMRAASHELVMPRRLRTTQLQLIAVLPLPWKGLKHLLLRKTGLHCMRCTNVLAGIRFSMYVTGAAWVVFLLRHVRLKHCMPWRMG